MSVPVMGPGATPTGATPTGGGQHVVGVRLVFSSDVTKAARDTDVLTDKQKRLNAERAKGAAIPASPGGVIGSAVPPAYVPRAMPVVPGAKTPAGAGGGLFGLPFDMQSIGVMAAIGSVHNLAKVMLELDSTAKSARDKLADLVGIVPIVGSTMSSMFQTGMKIRDRLVIGEADWLSHQDKKEQHQRNLGLLSVDLQHKSRNRMAVDLPQQAEIEADVWRTMTSPMDVNYYKEIDSETNGFRRRSLVIRQAEERSEAEMARDREVARRVAEDARTNLAERKRESNLAADAFSSQAQRLAGAESRMNFNPDAKPGVRYGQIGTASSFGVLGAAVGRVFDRRDEVQGAALGGASIEYQKHDDPVAKLKWEEEMMRYQKLQLEAKAKLTEYEKALAESREKSVRLTEIEAEHAKKRVEYARQYLAVKEGEYQMHKDSMVGFGLMAPDQQAAILQAADRTKGDFEKMTQEERQLWMSVPALAAQTREKQEKEMMARLEKGQGREFQLAQSVGINFKQMREEVEKSRVEFDLRVKIDEQAAKDAAAAVKKEFMKDFKEAIAEGLRIQRAEIEGQVQQGRAQRRQS